MLGKINYFYNKSVFGQLISLMDDNLVRKEVEKYNLDCYTKRFTTKDHLISMLFDSYPKFTLLREIPGAMLVLSGKTNDLSVKPYS